MKKYRISVGSIAWFSMLALISLGCSGGGEASFKKGLDPNSEGPHIAKAAGHVAKYISLPENRHANPKDTSALKDWAAKNNVPEGELVSTRDHEPYQIHELSKGSVIVVTETTGVNGKRFMFTYRLGARAPTGIEATQEEIDNALKPSKARPRGGPR